METQTKLRKKSFTIVEQAIHQVRGFRNLYQELDDKVRLSGQSISTLNNYARKLAQLSLVFRGKLMESIKRNLKKQSLLQQHQSLVNAVLEKPWVVHCEPSLGKPEHVVKYLGQYTHRVAITNQRIIKIDDDGVTFMHKDYSDNAKQKPVKLDGVEFLRRFCTHILPARFVKIRRYGIYSSRNRALKQKNNKKIV
ncbi:MAG: transposase, partial [Bacteroidales bacterium]